MKVEATVAARATEKAMVGNFLDVGAGCLRSDESGKHHSLSRLQHIGVECELQKFGSRTQPR